MITCVNCNAGLRFAPESQKLKCDHCSREYDVKSYDYNKYTVKYASPGLTELDDPFETEFSTYSCPSCGAEIISDENTEVTFCSYCGLSVQLKRTYSKMVAPSLIIPFKKTKDDCMNSYKKLIRKSPFAPSYMRKDTTVDKLRGIYMPYWLYSFSFKGKMAYNGESARMQQSGSVVHDYYEIKSDVDMHYNGISYDASSAFYDTFSSAISPYDRAEYQEYKPGYMSGFYADASNVPSDTYKSEAKQMVIRDIGMDMSKHRAFKKAGGDINLGYAKEGNINTDVTLAYLPVWFLSMRNKDNKVSYAVINGQSGKIAADVPIDRVRYFIGSILLAIPIIAGLLFWNSLSYSHMLMVSLLFAFVLMLIANKELDKVYTHINFRNDKGYQVGKYGGVLADLKYAEAYESKRSKREKKNPKDMKRLAIEIFIILNVWLLIVFVLAIVAKNVENALAWIWLFTFWITPFCIGMFPMLFHDIPFVNVRKSKRKVYIFRRPFLEKLPVLIKPLIISLIVAGVIIWNPKNDMYGFIAMLITAVLVFWTICDLIKAHNQLTLSDIPQFGKRGHA